jgi:hypothetical protein
VKTDARAIEAAKEPYRDVRLQGNVESEFLYTTFLSTDLVPFGHLPFRAVVLPILPKPEGYVMLTASEARQQGYLGLSDWLSKCEKTWEEKRGEKAERISIYGWLDYRRKLTQQWRKKYTILYPASATYLCAAVVENVARRDQQDKFIDESMLYYYDTEVAEEAYFLAAILNSSYMDKELKPLQAMGDFGPRHIHKKMWSFPIPSYEAINPAHMKLASLGADCTCTAATFVAGLSAKFREGSLGRLRTMMRENLKDRLSEIDTFVKGILQ